MSKLFKSSFLFILIFLETSHVVHSQPQQIKSWSLEDCISYGLKNNIDIKKQVLEAENKRIGLSQSKWSFAPDLYLSNTYNLSTGRVLDPTTYNFVENQSVNGNSSSISMNLSLTENLVKYHNLKISRLNLASSLLQIEEVRFDVRLHITANYLEVLCAKENIRRTKETMESLKIQVKKLLKKIENGKATQTDLLQIQSQMADTESERLAYENFCEVSKLSLCQLLEIETPASFDLPEPETFYNKDTTEFSVFESMIETVDRQPRVLIASTHLNIAKKEVQIAKTGYVPSISFSLGYSSSYSDARKKSNLSDKGEYNYSFYPFNEQYRDNANSYISFTFSFPILNKISARKEVQIKKNEFIRYKYELQSMRKKLIKEILEAESEYHTACEQYNRSEKFVSYAKEAFRQIEQKYEVGKASITDYQSSLITLVKAESQLLIYKYESIFKHKVLEYYDYPFTELH